MTDTTSEAYRAACEARQVAQWGDKQRRDYYEDVARHRGKPACNRLIESVNQERRGRAVRAQG